MVSDLIRSYLRCSPNSLYEKTQSCYLGKRRLQNVFNKRVPIIVANMFLEKKNPNIYFTM